MPRIHFRYTDTSLYTVGVLSPLLPLTAPASSQRPPLRTSAGPPESMLVAEMLPSGLPTHSSRLATIPLTSQVASGCTTVSASRRRSG
jgi:hypothetical protein